MLECTLPRGAHCYQANGGLQSQAEEAWRRSGMWARGDGWNDLNRELFFNNYMDRAYGIDPEAGTSLNDPRLAKLAAEAFNKAAKDGDQQGVEALRILLKQSGFDVRLVFVGEHFDPNLSDDIDAFHQMMKFVVTPTGSSGPYQTGGMDGFQLIGRAGGNGFGGGGASGSWEDATKPKDRPIGDMPEGLYEIYKPYLDALAKKRSSVNENGYTFTVDGLGRPLSVSGYLKLTPAERDRQAQLAAGGPDRLSNDEGGHLIAARFGGPANSKNLFPQNQNFNRSAYKALENTWVAALNRGESVWVKIEPVYSTSKTQRPDAIVVEYKIGQSNRALITFNNRPRN
ncbi:DNA/RNA non-specific endonuclease [Aquidulcibacter sp.]|uniref:DNA/RNA non-specific endonuclease n=1 Tax=Aquidulcibacter sp. TaxID=2052990 RepID=UPI0025C5A4EF|nr:DNA/RNA non-specific endonuclease [Aquidulcibacter sp.]MCA3696759.1 DNA/RNA non-specific endonuclease [Aquidulcibacter sp.]